MCTGLHQTDSRPSTHRARAALATGLLVALLGAGGCGSANDSAGDAKADRGVAAAEQGAGRGVSDDAQAADGPGDGAKAADKAPEAPKPGTAVAVHVIRTATLTIEVKSVPKAVAAARGAAENAGGLVADETTERVDDTYDMSHLVLRVPQDHYDSVLRTLAGSGKPLSRTSNAKDVTGQVVDVESRIATQRASVARVRDLMDKAEKLTDVVTLEGELSSRQASLESLLAQQASLKDRTSLATITLELSEPDAPVKESKDDAPGFLDALSGGWDAFVTMLRWIAVAVGATAPFLAAAAVLLLVRRLVRGRRPRGAGSRVSGAPAPLEAPEAPEAPVAPAAPGPGTTPAP